MDVQFIKLYILAYLTGTSNTNILMIIHQLEIENFKSYNGKQLIGPFDRHFNCVIGPNGNGKSNIIDAVLFVFGFKSSKLRQQSIASLIHKSAFAQPQFATVTVIFQEDKILTPISRTVLKSGHSYYRLNGQKVGWNQLRQKLISKRIDLNKNLFIILQGQVERLCELSPEKMVQYLEYVSGSDQYKDSIEEAEKKYVQKCITKEQMRASLKIKTKFYETSKEKAANQTNWLFLKLKVLLSQHIVLKKLLFETFQQLQALSSSQNEQIQASKQIQTQINNLEEKIHLKKKQINGITTQCRKGQEYINKIGQKRQAVNLKVKEINREINYIQKDKQKKEQERYRLEQQVRQLQQNISLHSNLIQKHKQLTSKFKKINQPSKFRLCLDLQQKVKESQAQEILLKKFVSELKEEIEQNRQKLRIYEHKYKHNKEAIIKLRLNIKQIQSQLKEINQNLEESQSLLSELQKQAREDKGEKINIGGANRMLTQVRQANKLKILCKDITLVTLRQLIIIEAQYSDIVETLLPHLDYFIVDNLIQAREVIDYLISRKLGRMTLLIKQSINESIQKIQVIKEIPKETRLLKDVCKCTGEQTKNLLTWILGNTLVTSKLQIAMKAAYYDDRHFQAVTTAGEFIDSSGTITKLLLKSSAGNNQGQIQAKKMLIQRKIASLKEKKQELIKKFSESQASLLNLESQQRSLDGLDQIFLEEKESQLKQKTQIFKKVVKQLSIYKLQLQKIKSQLAQSGFEPKKYQDTLALMKEYIQNQMKVKKVQNSNNISESIKKKSNEISKTIQSLSNLLEQKVKEKSTMENERVKISQLIDQKSRELTIVENGKKFTQAELKELQIYVKDLNQKLGETEKKGGSYSIYQQLRKIRIKIKQVEIDKLQYLNKLAESITQISDFSFIIQKLIQKNPELLVLVNITSLQEMNHSASYRHQFILDTILPLGKHEIKFSTFLSKKQMEFLQVNNKRLLNLVYQDVNRIKPDDIQVNILLDSINAKQFKFTHSFEETKLKQYQKEISKNEQSEINIDFQLFEDYSQHRIEWLEVIKSTESIQKDIQGLKAVLVDLRNRRLQIYMRCFNEINIELGRIYESLTGGKAELNLLDSMNPLEGIQFSVRPLNKSWKRVNLLSGGEKTFTSLALIFACEEIKKFPFYFMDEIDAALDYKNTTLLAQYVKSKTQTQHIVISLRKNMYQQCNRLVGVYKIKDQSRILQVKMQELMNGQNRQD